MNMEEFYKLKKQEEVWGKPYMPHIETVFLRINELNVNEHGYGLVKWLSKACEKAKIDKKLILSPPSQFPSTSFGGLLTDADVVIINTQLVEYHF